MAVPRASIRENLARLRRTRNLTQEALAERAGLSVDLIKKLEQGQRDSTRLATLEALAAALGVPLSELTEAATPRCALAVDDQPWATIGGMDADDLAEIRRTVANLVALDIRHGSAGLDQVATRAFADARRRLAVTCAPRYLTTLLVDAVAELGQVAAWTLHDAGRDNAARATLTEALTLAGTAEPGPHRAELMILDQLSMLAERAGSWAEALRLAERSLAATDTASPRLQAMAYIRRGRALASGGHRDGLADLHRAASMLGDGARDDDPPWAWWINQPEVTIHQALAASALGAGTRAVDLAHAAIDSLDRRQRRDAVIYRTALLRVAATTGAWREATDAASVLAETLPSAGSFRAVTTVRTVAANLPDSAPPDAVDAIRAALTSVEDIASP